MASKTPRKVAKKATSKAQKDAEAKVAASQRARLAAQEFNSIVGYIETKHNVKFSQNMSFTPIEFLTPEERTSWENSHSKHGPPEADGTPPR